MTAVLKHELRLYFHSLTAYVFGAFLLAFIGIIIQQYNGNPDSGRKALAVC